jgi:hypothetical protein
MPPPKQVICIAENKRVAVRDDLPVRGQKGIKISVGHDKIIVRINVIRILPRHKNTLRVSFRYSHTRTPIFAFLDKYQKISTPCISKKTKKSTIILPKGKQKLAFLCQNDIKKRRKVIKNGENLRV